MFSTGQGVVLDRSVYSDYVFVEAMCNSKYISKPVKSVYYDLKANSISELMKPHLVIYLDVPVDTVKQRIKERNIDYEVNSKALTDQYLQDIDTVYKQKFLKEVSIASELLVYDWSSGGDTEVVVEDIERIGEWRICAIFFLSGIVLPSNSRFIFQISIDSKNTIQS